VCVHPRTLSRHIGLVKCDHAENDDIETVYETSWSLSQSSPCWDKPRRNVDIFSALFHLHVACARFVLSDVLSDIIST